MAVSQFKSMLSTSTRGLYSISDYNYILSSLSSQGLSDTILRLGRLWDESQTHNNVFPNVDTWKILIDCHCATGNMSSAFCLFHNIIKAGHRPTASTLNYLLQGLCDRGQISKAIMFFNYSILKGFELDDCSYDILIHCLCGIGEIKMATHLLRQRPCEHDTVTCFVRLMVVYAKVISRLCEDRLVNEAYALFSEIVVKNKRVMRNRGLHHRLIYGYCITGQFKQAIAMFRELKAIENINTSTCIPTLELGTEHEVKAAKRALCVLIKRGVQPHLASYQSVVGGLYKGGRVKVARKVEELSLQFCKPFLE